MQGNELKYFKVSIDKFFQNFKLDYAAIRLPSLELLCWVHTGITNSKLLTLLLSIIFLKGLHSFQNLLFFTVITWALVTPFADKMADNYTELVLVTLWKLLATFSLNHNHVAHCYLGYKQFLFNRKRVNLIDTKLALSGNDKLRCPKEECIFDGKRKKTRGESRPKRIRRRAKPTRNKRTVVHRILCIVELGITGITAFFCFLKKLPL